MKRLSATGFLALCGFISSIVIGTPAYTGGTGNVAGSCAGYNVLTRRARAALATGYLEGVQAAVNKETRDMLVPPEDRDHPIWWVLPEGEVATDNLESGLTEFCKSKANEDKKLLDAFLGIAARQDGSPRLGIPFSDSFSDTWRTVLGESGLTCLNYRSANDTERANLIYGYFLGTNAVKLTLKTPVEPSLMIWPDADYREVKARVDAACKGTKYAGSTMRDVLWTITAEMGVEKIIARVK